LGQVGALGIERLFHACANVRVVAPEGEDAVAGEQIEVALAVLVDQLGALAALPVAVDAEGANDPTQLGVEIAVVERERIVRPGLEDLRYRRWNVGHR